MSTINIHIKSSGDSKYEVSVDTSSTIEDLKVIISAAADVPPERQRLIYSGKVLKDDQTVASYKIQDGHTVHLVKSAAAKPATPQPAVETAATDRSSGAPTNIAAGQGLFNPLADLTGARYAGYTQLPSALMFGPDGGMGAFPDPEQMTLMMDSPMFQEQMNALLLNPQMLDFMINQNPQLRAMGPQVRTMLQSPMFREMLLNPETMRSMMNMTRGAGAGGAGAFPAPGSNPTLAEGEAGATGDAATATTGAGAGATGAAGAANPFASLFLGGMPDFLFGGAGAGAAAEAQDTRPPEERFASQLGQLNDMGFFDFDQNVAALRRSGGNVQGAVEYLLSGTL